MTDSHWDLLSGFFLQAPVAICIFKGPQHTVEIINERMLDIMGRSLEQVADKPIFEALPDATGQGYEQILDNVYSTGKRFIAYELPVNLIRKGSKETFYIKFICEPLLEEGKVTGVMAVADEVTDLVKNREIAAESQVAYKQFVDAIPLAVYTCDKDGRITYYNDVAVKLWGYTPDIDDEGVKYCACYKVWMPDGTYVSPDKTPMAVSLQTGRSFRGVEALVERPNGEQFYAMVSINPLFDSNGNVRGAINIFQDISERKSFELALHESEQKYRNLVQGLPVAIYTTDINGYITLYNEAAISLWGREPEWQKDKWCGWLKIFKPDGITPLRLDECPMAVLLKEGRKTTGVEIIIERPDGSRRTVIPNPEPMYDSFGKLVGAVNTLIDITERKSEEERMARFEAIIQSSEDVIISKTLNGIVTSWNPAAERLYGYTSEEMIGQPISRIIPADRIDDEKIILEDIRKGKKVESFETKRITKDGRLVDMSLTISPLKNAKGEIIGASKIGHDITKQKQLHEALRASEERLRMAGESANIGTWEFHPVTRKLIWSAECKKIHGLPDHIEPDNSWVADHIYPEDLEYVRKEVAKALNPENNEPFHLEYRIIRNNDRQTRWIKIHGKMYFDENGSPARFIGTMLDITREKLQEQQLKESVELFQTMADNVPAMIWMSGKDRFNDYFNKTWLQFTGRTSQQESNEGWIEGVHPDDRQKCISSYNKALTAQTEFYTEYRLKRHDGQYRWIADNSVPRFSPDGEFIGFISACMDIDDQKRFREKLLANELLFKTISNAPPVGLWMTDTDGQNVFVNDTWVQWTGIPAGQQRGAGWMTRVVEEDKLKAFEEFCAASAKKEKYTTEFRLINQQGDMRWCLTEGYPYYDIEGKFAGYAGSVTDITDMKRLEQRKDDFIKMASHELKTPVTTIKGYIQLLMKMVTSKENPFFTDSLLTMDKQVSRLSKLIADLLDATKMETGQLKVNPEIFSIHEVIEDILSDVRTVSLTNAIVFDQHDDAFVYADKDRISQVINNLLNNAIKYSPGASEVIIETKMENNEIIVSVRDFGIGIAPENHEKIFERFYRVSDKKENTFPGFGIGLFIVKEIITLHKGRVWVESEQGKGALFSFSLPVHQKQ